MSRPFGWGVVAPGRIAQRFAQALQGVDGARLAAVCSRDAARGADFGRQWSKPDAPARVTDRLDELLADAAVDAVYVASPHAFHADMVRAGLAAGKPVLCEKPLAPNAPQARALVALARERRVFLMEAVWTRFLPIYAVVRGWLDDGAIDELRAMQSSFCFQLPFDPKGRHFDPEQAGGALLDIGIYNITVSRWVARTEVRGFEVAATRAPSGVDQRVVATLDLGGGVYSQFVCALDGSAENAFRIDGAQGHIVVHGPFWQATAATLHRIGQPPETAEAPFRVNGFEYEIEEVMRCVRAGRIESPTIPHDETIAVLELMDAMRARIGLRYPFE